MRTCICLVGLIALFPLSMVCPVVAAEPVIVHEWGTFTSLQDEQGKAIGGINVDDEPVPWFVCNVAGSAVIAQYAGGDHGPENYGLPPYEGVKGWADGDPAVTMRLETPVLYIYPPKGLSPQAVPPLDVHVDFHGGVLSQYYPYATVTGLPLNGSTPYLQEKLGSETSSGLTWKGVRIGASGVPFATTDQQLESLPWLRGKPVETDDKVWTAPREVSAPLLEVKFSEADNKGVPQTYTQAEHFLFYRGIGHLDSPLLLDQTRLDTEKRMDLFPWVHRTLVASPSFGSSTQKEKDTLEEAWLADIRADGTCRWECLTISFGPSGVGLAGKFDPGDLTPRNLAALKASMRDALVKEGLYPDEAAAMLKTWELSYFKSPGLRFFYIVPRAWVDKVLPLKITGAPAEITRVMVGRIELTTNEQKAALARLSAGPCPDLPAFKKAVMDRLKNDKLPQKEVEAFYHGEKPLSDLGVPMSPMIRDYLSLGRFRDALIVHEQQARPSPVLAQFIQDNHLAQLGN